MFTVKPIATDVGIYSVTSSDGMRLYIHKERRLIGSFNSVAKLLHISTSGLNYTRIKDITKAKPYSTNIPNISLYPIESYIKYINEYGKKDRNEKLRCINILNDYLRAIDDSMSIQTDMIDSISSLERRISKLEHILSRILETHPDIIDESVKVIDSSTIMEYNIVITADNEIDSKFRLNIETILPDEHEPVENALMDKVFYVSMNQISELKQNMLIKSDGNLIEMGTDYAIVNDVEDFIDVFKHKLRKIQKNNKKSECASTCSSAIE